MDLDCIHAFSVCFQKSEIWIMSIVTPCSFRFSLAVEVRFLESFNTSDIMLKFCFKSLLKLDFSTALEYIITIHMHKMSDSLNIKLVSKPRSMAKPCESWHFLLTFLLERLCMNDKHPFRYC